MYFNDTAVVLLKFLAIDAYEISNASEFGTPPEAHTHGAQDKDFYEQYSYYRSQDTWVIWDTEANVINGYLENRGLRLIDYADCFRGWWL